MQPEARPRGQSTRSQHACHGLHLLRIGLPQCTGCWGCSGGCGAYPCLQGETSTFWVGVGVERAWGCASEETASHPGLYGTLWALS